MLSEDGKNPAAKKAKKKKGSFAESFAVIKSSPKVPEGGARERAQAAAGPMNPPPGWGEPLLRALPRARVC